MISHPGLIDDAEGILRLTERLSGHPMIAFDTEFIRETTFYPMIEILQIATEEESWLVDARAFRKKEVDKAWIKPLFDVFSDPKVLKIVHAAQGDQECLYTSFGVVASPSLDTAAAASLCGFGEAVGLGNLLKSVLGVQIKKGHARTDWSVRPLPAQLEEYAHVDVVHLIALAKRLLEMLDEQGRRPWAMELSAKFEDKKLYEPNPEEIATKLARGGRLDKRGYSALVELVKWREERVRQLNLPRRWVADDNVLLDLAQVRPKDIEHLSAFRGLNKGELQKSGPAILAALQTASETQEIQLPKMPKPDIPSESESQVLELMKCFVGILADKHKIALKHLMTSNLLLPILKSKALTPEDLVRKGLLTEGAAQLVGPELIAFIQGRRGLHVRDFAVEIVETPVTL